MAKTAAKKRPPARAKATARSAPAKPRTAAKKPAAKAVKAKVRTSSKVVEKPAARPVAKKASRSSARPANAAKSAGSAKAVTRAKSKPAAKKSGAKTPVITAAKALVKKVITLAKPAVKAMTPTPVASPKINGEVKNGFAKRNVTPVVETKAAPVKPAVKPPATRPEPVLVPDSRVATNLKPRKNQAGLGVKELETFRTLLLEKRREILGDMRSMESEALGSGGGGLSTLPVHMADMGTDNYEQEFTLGLVEKDRVLLREINNALAKIQNGAYGICEGNGTAIGKARLEVQPWARFSIEFARIRERNGMGIR